VECFLAEHISLTELNAVPGDTPGVANLMNDRQQPNVRPPLQPFNDRTPNYTACSEHDDVGTHDSLLLTERAALRNVRAWLVRTNHR
jgi:hypothetical protein